ncbi:ATP-binding protein [Sphaerisporangium melleum]|nr:ATP-binding protein [Sphaerisporangium melleum]
MPDLPSGLETDDADGPVALPADHEDEGVRMTPEKTDEGLWAAAGLEIEGDVSAVGRVRALIKETLGEWELSRLTDDVELVVGELLANAITHGAAPVRVSMWGGAGELFLWVTDRGTEMPRRLDLGIDSTHGRGLAIVAALTDDHGVTPLPGGPGKTVWARWRYTTPEDAGTVRAPFRVTVSRRTPPCGAPG